MSESMFGDAGAARNSRRRSTARTGSAKSPATTPGQSAGEPLITAVASAATFHMQSLASGQRSQQINVSICCIYVTCKAYSWLAMLHDERSCCGIFKTKQGSMHDIRVCHVCRE